MAGGMSRRDVLRTAAAAGAAAVFGGGADAAIAAEDGAHTASPATWRTDFTSLPDGDGWGDAWTTVGVANLRRRGGEGLLEAGSDIFPNDPRPVAFAVDHRVRDLTVAAVVTRAGSATGVVARRVSPRDYYAAVYDTVSARLQIVRRTDFDLVELAATPVPASATPRPDRGTTAALELEATGINPTRLLARLTGADGATYVAEATDATEALQAHGDPGVLTRAETFLPTTNPVIPALGNIRLAAYGVQEGQLVLESPPGQAFIGQIREQSTAGFAEITVSSGEEPRATVPTVFAATTGAPTRRGATVHIAADLPADVALEVASSPAFADPRRVEIGTTGRFAAVTAELDDLEPASEVYWRARLRRQGHEHVGPTRRFRTLPAPGATDPVTMSVAACGSQFNAIFDRLAERDADVFVWQGDLNYPDTHGPLAQTMSGYAGIWRHFLDNPRLRPALAGSAFVGERDDHDYGVQDANATNLVPHGLAPWNALMNGLLFRRFAAGLMDVWVLDQRRFKSPPGQPDTLAKTLLGVRQRAWLLDTLTASPAPFKIICSPCTLAPTSIVNERDGSWATGYTAERDLLLAHIEDEVDGRTLFLTGDTHLTMVYDDGSLFEARACPVDLPKPNDITLTDPLGAQQLRENDAVVFSSDENFFSHLSVAGDGDTARLELELVGSDGEVAHRTAFEQPIGGVDPSRSGPSEPGARDDPSAGGAGERAGLPATGNTAAVSGLGAAAAVASAAARRRLQQPRRDRQTRADADGEAG